MSIIRNDAAPTWRPPVASEGSDAIATEGRGREAPDGGKRSGEVGAPADTYESLSGAAPLGLAATGSGSPLAAGPSLDGARAGSEAVRRGSRGESVAELQRRLNAAGCQPPLAADGAFGPKTESAVRQFQSDHGLRADGVVGPRTMAVLDQLGNNAADDVARRTGAPRPSAPPVDPNAPVPAGEVAPTERSGVPQGADNFATEPGRASGPFSPMRAEREQQAESVLRANGLWPPEEGHTYAIQVDQDPPAASAPRQNRLEHVLDYTGQTSVFRCENGRLVEQIDGAPLQSASHPGQLTTSFSGTPDVNNDGGKDIAHLRPGVYEYRSRPTGNGRYNPADNRRFDVARDTNHNGVIDGSEVDRGYRAGGIQIHAGGANRPSSVGCQTLPPNDYSRFQDALHQSTGNRGTFTYVMVRRDNERFGANPQG
ncbi:MAG: peptidoglycan-binding protein [Candidatus Schekmanbacteria bacterium]|nr:peptidoglycan-binding protein [Candidatus Schekmanbacteria bacterium]